MAAPKESDVKAEEVDSIAEAIAAHTDQTVEELRERPRASDIEPPWDADTEEQ